MRIHYSKFCEFFNVDPGQNIHLLCGISIFQGFFGTICIVSDFHCVSNMPLGDASAIILSATLPSIVLSAIFLGSRLRLYKIICGVIFYSGVLLVIRPPFLFHRWASPKKEFGSGRFNLKSSCLIVKYVNTYRFFFPVLTSPLWTKKWMVRPETIILEPWWGWLPQSPEWLGLSAHGSYVRTKALALPIF